jgi:hypothetical protein
MLDLGGDQMPGPSSRFPCCDPSGRRITDALADQIAGMFGEYFRSSRRIIRRDSECSDSDLIEIGSIGWGIARWPTPE